MTRYFPLLETRIVLRTVIFGAGVLAVLLVLACAGTAAGAEDTIEVRSGTYVENVDVEKRLMLPALALGENATVNVTWNDIRISGYPTHHIITIIDPMGEIDEDNNNETVLVYADLRADRIVFVSPQEDKLSLDAEKFVIDGTIANRGDEDGIIVPVSDFDVMLEFRKRYPNGTVGDVVFDVTEHIEEPLYANEDREIRFEFDPSEELEVGGNYTVSLIADSSGDVCESSELYPDGEDNNITSMNIYVYNSSGYAGGSNLTNVAQGEVHGRMVYTIGDSRYAGLTHPGGEETVRYPGIIPDDADIEFARIFVYWFTWHNEGGRVIPVMADMNVTFNGHNLTKSGNYSDTIGATHYDPGYGMYSYDVTDYATSGENEAAVKNNAEWNMGIHAIGLLVLYEDEDEPLTKYWINEGADIMMAANGMYPTGIPGDDCIMTATFEGVERNDTENVNATLLTVLGMYTQFDESVLFSDEGDALKFNNQSIGSLIYTGYWEYHYSNTGIALTKNIWDDVTNYLKPGDNLAEIQSKGNFMMPANAFLRLIFPPDLNITNLTAPDSIVVGKEYPINVTIRNDGRSDAHDFNVTLCIDTMQIICIPNLDLPAGNSTTLHLYNWTPMMLDHVYNLTVTADILSGEDWTEVEADNNGVTVGAGAPGVGDLNGDNEITSADAVIALEIAAGGSASCDLTTLAAADVSGDNRVTSLDALMILQAAAERIEL